MLGRGLILCVFLIFNGLEGGISDRITEFRDFRFSELEVDTLRIVTAKEPDSCDSGGQYRVRDERGLPKDLLDIHQTVKLRYIPVDQLLVSDTGLDTLFSREICSGDTGELKIKHLRIWYDGKPFRSKGWVISAYTLHSGVDGRADRDWLWERRLSSGKKESKASVIGRGMAELAAAQADSLETFRRELRAESEHSLYPYLYRRQLDSWVEWTVFPDGYSVNAHLTLDYPEGRQRSWVRGSPGIYYRRSRTSESLSIGGRHQSWNRRLSPALIWRSEIGLRMGFNHFDPEHYDHLAIQELFYAGLTWGNNIYRVLQHHRGIYGGLGIQQHVRILPTVLPRYEAGISLTVGIKLP